MLGGRQSCAINGKGSATPSWFEGVEKPQTHVQVRCTHGFISQTVVRAVLEPY